MSSVNTPSLQNKLHFSNYQNLLFIKLHICLLLLDLTFKNFHPLVSKFNASLFYSLLSHTNFVSTKVSFENCPVFLTSSFGNSKFPYPSPSHLYQLNIKILQTIPHASPLIPIWIILLLFSVTHMKVVKYNSIPFISFFIKGQRYHIFTVQLNENSALNQSWIHFHVWNILFSPFLLVINAG